MQRVQQCSSFKCTVCPLLLHIRSKTLCLQALSPVGRCQTFEASADGYGRGEAFATVCLCQAGKGSALGILKGSAVNQDGRSSSLTAPNGPSQQVLSLTHCCDTVIVRKYGPPCSHNSTNIQSSTRFQNSNSQKTRDRIEHEIGIR